METEAFEDFKSIWHHEGYLYTQQDQFEKTGEGRKQTSGFKSKCVINFKTYYKATVSKCSTGIRKDIQINGIE